MLSAAPPSVRRGFAATSGRRLAGLGFLTLFGADSKAKFGGACAWRGGPRRAAPGTSLEASPRRAQGGRCECGCC
ncbi:hypothetical protein V6Z11_D05G401700 [Gossypium hirsutum]